jgi:hypothetical protein
MGQQLSSVPGGVEKLRAVTENFATASKSLLRETDEGLLTNDSPLLNTLGEIQPALRAALTNTKEPGLDISGAIRYLPNSSTEINYQATLGAIQKLGRDALTRLGLEIGQIDIIMKANPKQKLSEEIKKIIDDLAKKLGDAIEKADKDGKVGTVIATANQEQNGKSIIGSYPKGVPLPGAEDLKGLLENAGDGRNELQKEWQDCINLEVALALDRAKNTTSRDNLDTVTFTVFLGNVKDEVGAQLDVIYGQRKKDESGGEYWETTNGKKIRVMTNAELDMEPDIPGEGVKGTYVRASNGGGSVKYCTEDQRLREIARGEGEIFGEQPAGKPPVELAATPPAEAEPASASAPAPAEAVPAG